MSDTEYRERAARQGRAALAVATAIVLVACVGFGAASAFRDSCTGSFERSPRSVVLAFFTALTGGQGERVQRCWDSLAYYELDAGCSQICLSRIMGTQYRLVDLSLSESYSEGGRQRITAAVSVTCPESEALYRGEVVLDGIGQNVPWRHWKIARSSFGGRLAEPWCK
jgi:hypothetical protein